MSRPSVAVAMYLCTPSPQSGHMQTLSTHAAVAAACTARGRTAAAARRRRRGGGGAAAATHSCAVCIADFFSCSLDCEPTHTNTCGAGRTAQQLLHQAQHTQQPGLARPRLREGVQDHDVLVNQVVLVKVADLLHADLGARESPTVTPPYTRCNHAVSDGGLSLVAGAKARRMRQLTAPVTLESWNSRGAGASASVAAKL